MARIASANVDLKDLFERILGRPTFESPDEKIEREAKELQIEQARARPAGEFMDKVLQIDPEAFTLEEQVNARKTGVIPTERRYDALLADAAGPVNELGVGPDRVVVRPARVEPIRIRPKKQRGPFFQFNQDTGQYEKVDVPGLVDKDQVLKFDPPNPRAKGAGLSAEQRVWLNTLKEVDRVVAKGEDLSDNLRSRALEAALGLGLDTADFEKKKKKAGWFDQAMQAIGIGKEKDEGEKTGSETVTFIASDGKEWTIPASKLAAAKKKDPKLKVK